MVQPHSRIEAAICPICASECVRALRAFGGQGGHRAAFHAIGGPGDRDRGLAAVWPCVGICGHLEPFAYPFETAPFFAVERHSPGRKCHPKWPYFSQRREPT